MHTDDLIVALTERTVEILNDWATQHSSYFPVHPRRDRARLVWVARYFSWLLDSASADSFPDAHHMPEAWKAAVRATRDEFIENTEEGVLSTVVKIRAQRQI